MTVKTRSSVRTTDDEIEAAIAQSRRSPQARAVSVRYDEVDDAVFILGPEKGLALVESLEGVGAVIVDSHNKVWTSKRLEGKVQPVHAPTDGL